MSGLRGGLCLVALFSFIAPTALAQWTTQAIQLQPGWNAIYLEVQPGPADCDTVFSGLPVESVWAWNRRASPVQFIQDPEELLPGEPDWLTYLPPDHPARETRTLFSMRGGQCYLLKLKSGAAARAWGIKGQPVLRPIDWLPDSYNLVGFPIAPNGAPTFQAFFSAASAHANGPAYRLGATGRWQLVANPATSTLRSGEAYWIYCRGNSTFNGPLEVEAEQRDGLVYGRILMEQTLRIRNASSAPATLTVRELASHTPPDGDTPILAGGVPLTYFRIDAAQSQLGWVPLPGSLERPSVGPGEDWILRLAVDRSSMAEFTPPAAHHGVLYQSLLEITDGRGQRQLISVSSEGLKSFAGSSLGLRFAGSPQPFADETSPRAGLWVGSATIEQVSQPSNIAAPDEPVATAAPFQFRLILHVDSAGQVRLLQRVIQMFKEGTLKPDPIDPELRIVDQPGRFVLVTDERLIPQFSGAALRDGQPIGRRISSPAFGFSQPILLTATGQFGAGKLNGTVSLGFDHPLNPFKHKYHPDHDNLDARFEQTLPEGTESFSVSRDIEMEFTAEDPDQLAVPGWGDNQLGGTYREVVTGLHRVALRAAGTFRLTRVVPTPVLNDGL